MKNKNKTLKNICLDFLSVDKILFYNCDIIELLLYLLINCRKILKKK